MSSSGSGTEINYGSGSDFLTSSGSGSGSTSQKVPVPVPVPQHWTSLSIFSDFWSSKPWIRIESGSVFSLKFWIRIRIQ
jgi:hypothetical protein